MRSLRSAVAAPSFTAADAGTQSSIPANRLPSEELAAGDKARTCRSRVLRHRQRREPLQPHLASATPASDEGHVSFIFSLKNNNKNWGWVGVALKHPQQGHPHKAPPGMLLGARPLALPAAGSRIQPACISRCISPWFPSRSRGFPRRGRASPSSGSSAAARGASRGRHGHAPLSSPATFFPAPPPPASCRVSTEAGCAQQGASPPFPAFLPRAPLPPQPATFPSPGVGPPGPRAPRHPSPGRAVLRRTALPLYCLSRTAPGAGGEEAAGWDRGRGGQGGRRPAE